MTKRKSKLTHTHHIIPKHAGGTDEPSNLVELTVEEHAEAHRLLWEQYGRQEDRMAWYMLSGKTEEGEAIRIELAKTAIRSKLFDDPIRKEEWRLKIKNARAKQVFTEETNQKRSESIKRAYAEGRKKYVPMSDDTKEKHSKRCRDNSELLAEGRRNSEVWKNSITNDEYKDKKRQLSKKNAQLGITFNDRHRENLSKAAKSRIFMTDTEGHLRHCKPDQVDQKLSEGWVLGKPKMCRINNGQVDREIPLSHLDRYLSEGWFRGGLSRPRSHHSP